MSDKVDHSGVSTNLKANLSNISSIFKDPTPLNLPVLTQTQATPSQQGEMCKNNIILCFQYVFSEQEPKGQTLRNQPDETI
jgi:hypothetical protein